MKFFKLLPDQIRDIAIGYGSCLATDRITVDGQRVGYCCRDESIDDTGSAFVCG
jgi:hypothetical protein